MFAKSLTSSFCDFVSASRAIAISDRFAIAPFIMKSCSAVVAFGARSSRAASTPRPRLHAVVKSAAIVATRQNIEHCRANLISSPIKKKEDNQDDNKETHWAVHVVFPPPVLAHPWCQAVLA